MTPPASTTIEIDQAKNLIVIRYRGRVGTEDARQYFEEARDALSKMQPGFRLLADLTELESMDVAMAPYIENIMDLFNEKGISTVVRVIPDQTRDIGLQIMSLFHYGENVHIVTCATLEEAMSVLAA